jgi:hypothetical protein
MEIPHGCNASLRILSKTWSHRDPELTAALLDEIFHGIHCPEEPVVTSVTVLIAELRPPRIG